MFPFTFTSCKVWTGWQAAFSLSPPALSLSRMHIQSAIAIIFPPKLFAPADRLQSRKNDGEGQGVRRYGKNKVGKVAFRRDGAGYYLFPIRQTSCAA